MSSQLKSAQNFFILCFGAGLIGLAPLFVRWSDLSPSWNLFYRMFLALPFLALINIYFNRAEAFKLKSKNNIRYLNTNNDFRIGLEKNITCSRTNSTNLNKKFLLIEKNLNNYSSSFLKKNNIKYLVMCENLFISNINTGGIPDTKKRTLIIDINLL